MEINGAPLIVEDIGTTPANTVAVHSTGTGTDKRVIGADRDVRCLAGPRGTYAFYFPARADLDVRSVTVRATAAGYLPGGPAPVDLGTRNANHCSFDLLHS